MRCDQHDNCIIPDIKGTLCFPSACGAYHALSPLLQNLGVFTSYNGHAEIISQLVEKQNTVCSSVPKVIVVGFSSKETVRALLDIPVTQDLEITFLDRCPTPVSQARAEFGNRANIHFQNTDIFEFETNYKYDLILTDSLLKQFQTDEKRLVIKKLVHLLKNTGKIVFREYVGLNNCDLNIFLNSIEENPLFVAWNNRACEECRSIVRRLLPSLKEYMLSVGGSYASWELFFKDILDANLEVDKFASAFYESFGIVICAKKETEVDYE